MLLFAETAAAQNPFVVTLAQKMAGESRLEEHRRRAAVDDPVLYGELNLVSHVLTH